MELASIFDVEIKGESVWAVNQFSWLAASRQLVEQIDRGNHYQMLEAILSALEQANKTSIARTDWERREAHQCASPKIERLIAALEQLGYRVISENPLRARHGAVGWASAYLSAIGMEELAGVAFDRIASDFRAFEMLAVLLVGYLALVLTLSASVRMLEHRLQAPFRR